MGILSGLVDDVRYDFEAARWGVRTRKLRQMTTQVYGERCADFNEDCITCRAHKIIDQLEELDPTRD